MKIHLILLVCILGLVPRLGFASEKNELLTASEHETLDVSVKDSAKAIIEDGIDSNGDEVKIETIEAGEKKSISPQTAMTADISDVMKKVEN